VWCNFIKNRTSFLTLTFKDNQYADYKQASAEITGFFKRLQYRLYKSKKATFKYLLVPELQHKREIPVWHFHILLFDVPYLDKDVISSVWGLGFVKINAVWNDSRHCANYLVKYFSKAYIMDYIKGRRRYYHSLNLASSVKYKGGSGENLFTFFFEKDGGRFRQLFHYVDNERKFSYSIFEEITLFNSGSDLGNWDNLKTGIEVYG